MTSQLLRDPNVDVPEGLLDFKNFLWLIWDHLLLPDPTDMQYEAADWLQYGPRRRMMKGYRGFGKSYETSAYALWRLYLNPQLKVLVISAAKDRATAFSTFTKRLIDEMPILQHLRPDPDKGHRDSVIAFDVGPSRAAHAPSVKSVGIFGAITGSRADLIIVDDMEIPNNSETQSMRIKLRERSKEIEAVLTEDGEVVFLCTDQSQESVYKELAKFYKPRLWPARYPRYDDLRKYGDTLAPSIREALEANPELGGVKGSDWGEPTDRFSDEELRIREAIYGRSGFALQFMLDPALGDDLRYPLRVSDFIVYPVDMRMGPEHLIWSNRPDLRFQELPNVALNDDHYHNPLEVIGEYQDWINCVMAIDPSGKGHDEVGIAITKGMNGFVHISWVEGLQGGYEDKNLVHICEKAKEHGVRMIRIEENFGGGMFAQLLMPHLKRIHPDCGIEEVRHNTQKEKRIIDTLEPMLNQHRLVIDPRVLEHDYQTVPDDIDQSRIPEYRLIYQMTRITADRGCLRHDDRLDALAMSVAYWTESAALDAKKRIQGRIGAEERKDWVVFQQSVISPGREIKNDKWKSVTPSVLAKKRTAKSGDMLAQRKRKR